ncbi:hypothetical protein NC652_018356 [Populus alba x Populus x berolinensis]|nr:hypothetical protein NC652_018356 [Populus alba x Populus x berolinensis]
MAHVSDIKLIRTDTTLDLSQKAEKGAALNIILCFIDVGYQHSPFFSPTAPFQTRSFNTRTPNDWADLEEEYISVLRILMLLCVGLVGTWLYSYGSTPFSSGPGLMCASRFFWLGMGRSC